MLTIAGCSFSGRMTVVCWKSHNTALFSLNIDFPDYLNYLSSLLENAYYLNNNFCYFNQP